MLARKALAGTAGAPKEYVEDVFSTYLYTGTGATQTITNGIDLSTKGGLVWTKERTSVAGAVGHQLTDTARGYEYQLRSDSTAAQTNEFNRLTSFNTNGFTLGNSSNVNANTGSWVSFSFRKAKKFFDVVTYTGNGSTGRNISHNLGSTPGCIIIKSRTGSDAWIVYHRGADNKYGQLAATNAFATDNGTFWGNGSTFTAPTSTVFTVSDHSAVNGNGATYVAYLFAHDAGGFGDAGSDSIIKCGSFTTASATLSVTLGWEPQWILFKRSDSTGDWQLYDNMRGMVSGGSQRLYPNLSNAEDVGAGIQLTATGFEVNTTYNATFIYVAIRRGPMKTPTSGTSVFNTVARTGSSSNSTNQIGVTNGGDLFITKARSTTYAWQFLDCLRGYSKNLDSSSSGSESTDSPANFVRTTSVDYTVTGSTIVNNSGQTHVDYLLRRAPGFFDVVCYTGTGSNLTVAHNLTVVPELIIAKNRTTAGNNWPATFNFTSTNSSYAFVNLTSAGGNDTYANVGVMTAQPTSTNLYLSSSGSMNTNGNNHVAYLFASVSGVSKVGSYTGNGSSQTINCGFTGGSRFVLIKATSTTGDWVVFDSARGIVSGSDPYLRLNSTAAEVTDKDAVDTDNTGFVVNETTGPNVNTNGVSYIYLAIS